jgi:hypothetical protein
MSSIKRDVEEASEKAARIFEQQLRDSANAPAPTMPATRGHPGAIAGDERFTIVPSKDSAS